MTLLGYRISYKLSYRHQIKLAATLRQHLNSLQSKYYTSSTLLDFSDHTRTGISKLISRCALLATLLDFPNCTTTCISKFKYCFPFNLSNCLSDPIPCPPTNPYAINGGQSCCKFYRQRNDPTLCPGNNHTSLTEPVECCADGYINCPDTDNGCKNYALANGIYFTL